MVKDMTMPKGLILLVEDNERVNAFNRRMLEMKGYRVETATTLSDARESLARCIPDALVLDIGMPDGNGLDFLAHLRKTSKIPVLLLTGNSTSHDITAGFERGCNDYLPKPYHFDVLLARLNNMLQGAQQVAEKIEKGPLTLRTTSMTAFLDDTDLLLSQKEFSLLLIFIQNEDRTLSTEHLYEQVWGQSMNEDRQAVRVAVSRLRSKLATSGYSIKAEYGEGYRFEKS
jgi:DNA-binding response OmpR family regulator